MAKILSTNYSSAAFNVATLLLRLTFGIFMLVIGYDKLVNFAARVPEFYSFLGLGSKVSLILVVFAEFFCSALLIIGLFTRFACIPLIITMAVAAFIVLKADIFGNAQTATIYLSAYIAILLLGPGKISVDGMIGK